MQKKVRFPGLPINIFIGIGFALVFGGAFAGAAFTGSGVPTWVIVVRVFTTNRRFFGFLDRSARDVGATRPGSPHHVFDFPIAGNHFNIFRVYRPGAPFV